MRLPKSCEWTRLPGASLLVTLVAMAFTGARSEPANGQTNAPAKKSHPALRVALAQIPVEAGKLDINMSLAEAAAARAADQKVDLFNLPEAADWGWLHQEARRDAFPIPGKYSDFLCELA